MITYIAMFVIQFVVTSIASYCATGFWREYQWHRFHFPKEPEDDCGASLLIKFILYLIILSASATFVAVKLL